MLACKRPKDCGPGETCLTYSHPECRGAKCQECQIRCAANADCSVGYACNLPPARHGPVHLFQTVIRAVRDQK